MMLTTTPYRRTQPLARRRATLWTLGISVLLLQLTLPSLDSTRWTGVLPLLLFPVIAACLHGLTSDTWVWNRLFRKECELDEYEVHARNAFIARAYALTNGWAGLLLFLAFIVGGGFLNHRFPQLHLFPEANGETAAALLFLILLTGFQVLPRLVAAVSEDQADDQ